MRLNEFKSVFEDIDYTPEFKQMMEKKLSALPAAMFEDKNENTVSGVERIDRSRIFYKVGVVAASAAIVAGGVGIAARMNKLPVQENPIIPAATDTTDTTGTTDTTVPTGMTDTPDTITPVVYPLEYIDEENMTDEELAELMLMIIEDIDYYTYYFATPYQYSSESYYQAYESDPEAADKTYEEYAIEKGWLIKIGEDYAYIADNKSKQTLYDEIYMRFTDDYETGFDALVHERDGKAYCIQSHVDLQVFNTGCVSDITIKSRNSEEIVLEVYFDYTKDIFEGILPNMIDVSELDLAEDYTYKYPQQVTLKNTDKGWRVSEYKSYSELSIEAFDNCDILKEAEMKTNQMYKFVGTWRQSAFPDKDYEVVVNSAEKLPDGRVYADIELKNFEKFDDFRTQIDYNEDVFGSFYITGKNGEEYHCNFNLRDDGTIYFYLMEKNELESHGVMCFTFDEKIV